MPRKTRKPTPVNMHPEDIKAMIRKKYGSLALVADAHGLSHSTVQCAVYRPVPAGNYAIAQALGMSVHELWPEWFHANGKRILSTRTGQANKNREDDKVLSGFTERKSSK